MRLHSNSLALTALFMLAACGDDSRPSTTRDSGPARVDSGTLPRTDAGPGTRTDAGPGGDFDAGPGGDCAAASCDDCTPMAGCGWCDTTMTCQAGMSGGPTSGSCADWRYVPSECAAPIDCTMATTCGECTAMGPCGFCGASGMCLRGNTDGPAMGSCASGWAWISSECEGGVDAGMPE